MSEDLIKRSDAAEVVYKALKTPSLKGVLTDTMSLAIALVRNIPSADRSQGEWIVSYIDGIKQTECSACKESFITYDVYGWNYCPWCGAKMKGVDDESTL